MSEPFIAEIRIFGYNFAPKNWAFCDGQIMPIQQNTALFSLVGTTYGGNGQTTFGLPNLQGRVPMHPGSGPGLTPRVLGETDGTETVTVLSSQMPAHTHGLGAQTVPLGGSASPAGNTLTRPGSGFVYDATSPSGVAMAPQAVGFTGGTSPHNNMQPYLSINFCIALFGVFPQRN